MFDVHVHVHSVREVGYTGSLYLIRVLISRGLERRCTFWAMTLYNFADVYRRFGETCWLHLEGRPLNMEAIGSTETLVTTY